MDRINIPLEIIEEILVNLPVKSLRRFSAVSKPWKAMISDEEFIRRHERRSRERDRERILLTPSWRSLLPATTRPLSSIPSNNRLGGECETPFVFPLELENVEFRFSCSDMWCVENWGSFFLLNPSTGAYRMLPHSFYNSMSGFFSFGMWFDSVADDYKILKVRESAGLYGDDELYSLRSDSARKTEPFPKHRRPRGNAVFVNNALHWMTNGSIVSFDSSTEKYADGAVPPPFDLEKRAAGKEADLTVLRGKLCLYFNYARKFVLWEMQEYGDGSSWTKMMEVGICSLIKFPIPRQSGTSKTIMTPLYHYHDDGMMLMKLTNSKSQDAIIFMVSRDEPHVVNYSYTCGCTSGTIYVETLVSPAIYTTREKAIDDAEIALSVSKARADYHACVINYVRYEDDDGYMSSE